MEAKGVLESPSKKARQDGLYSGRLLMNKFLISPQLDYGLCNEANLRQGYVKVPYDVVAVYPHVYFVTLGQ